MPDNARLPQAGDPLYKKELLRLAADAAGAGHLSAPHGSGSAHNPACGDKVTVDLAIKNGCVETLAHRTHACILTQASASILGGALAGLNQAEISALQENVRAMLEGGAVPTAPFHAFAALESAGAHKSRHACVLLPFEAVLAAFDACLAPLEPGKPGAARA